MQAPKPPHPVQAEIDRRGLSYEQAAKLCRKLGWRPSPSPNYLENVCRGWNEPGFEFAYFLAEKLCEGRVSAESIKNYPYNRSRKRRVA